MCWSPFEVLYVINLFNPHNNLQRWLLSFYSKEAEAQEGEDTCPSSHSWCSGLNGGPPRYQVIIPGTCECCGKVFAFVIKLRILRWGDYSGLSRRAVSATTCVMIRARQRKSRWTCRGEGDVKTEAEVAVMLQQTKECQQPPEGALPSQLLAMGFLTPWNWCWPSGIQNCERMSFCCCKSPSDRKLIQLVNGQGGIWTLATFQFSSLQMHPTSVPLVSVSPSPARR